jgi:hypothetical protein
MCVDAELAIAVKTHGKLTISIWIRSRGRGVLFEPGAVVKICGGTSARG